MAETTVPSSVDVAIWSVDLDVSDQVRDRLAGILDDEERARAGRFCHRNDGRRWIVARAARRCILASVLAVTGEALRFGRTGLGKPVVVGADDLDFSVSHADRLCLIAVARGASVGIDVERVTPRLTLDALAQGFLCPAELALMRGADNRLRTLYRFWTRKEAYVKALGIGLSVPPNQIDVSVEARPKLLGRHADDPTEWSLQDLTPAPSYIGALAAHVRQIAVSFHRFDFAADAAGGQTLAA
ncbi:MAG TPA: 4'-phosphopantetheinyl transferase superfamily protein [Alphaproteobacteria bacterium]